MVIVEIKETKSLEIKKKQICVGIKVEIVVETYGHGFNESFLCWKNVWISVDSFLC